MMCDFENRLTDNQVLGGFIAILFISVEVMGLCVFVSLASTAGDLLVLRFVVHVHPTS